MSINYFHSFHIVDVSPWPICVGTGMIIVTIGGVGIIHYSSMVSFWVGFVVVGVSAGLWWRDVIREATLQGHHTTIVIINIKYGIVLFIVSEVLFFFSFFWSYFHSSLTPVYGIGISWPPVGVEAINPFSVPLLNTVILLGSSVTVTWCHYSILNNLYSESYWSLVITLLLGVYFIIIQGIEYSECSFSISDSVFGSVFFVATGFHGIHVIVGASLLFVCLYRVSNCMFSEDHHFGLEASIWYWHFVDVVWLFLFISVYWWSIY